MKLDRGNPGHMPIRRLLVQRIRVIMAICAVGASLYVVNDLRAWQADILPAFVIKLVGIALTLLTIALVGQRWAVRRIYPLSVVIIGAAYVLPAISAIVTPTDESRATAVLFAGATLFTGTLLPWGLWAQLASVAIAASALGATVLLSHGAAHVLSPNPGIAVAIAFVVSLIAAREVGRYRIAHRRELIDRRRAEGALRRLALRLEQRVADRTLALERAHEAGRQHQAELAHVLRLHTMGEMAATLAHEINQPLCAITNYAQGGVQRLRAGDQDLAALGEAFERIAREGLRAAQILRGIRKLVQRETAVSAGVDVNALAVEALQVLEPQARRHGVVVRLERDERVPTVHADGTQIEQVMLNLMLNGVEAAALAQGTRREVVIATTALGDAVEVAISDTGTGLAPAVRDRLFTPFLTTKTRGLGLGLAISRSIVESHGGRLWASPRPGAGMTFRFSIPRSDGLPPP
ncbi:MAG: ATP-binding protein [Deltaproteobacteria bacterium]|nr:ATP-binding protein [Deltaproteobacteria bacterium]